MGALSTFFQPCAWPGEPLSVHQEARPLYLSLDTPTATHGRFITKQLP